VRKTNLFGATMLALTTGAWSLSAVAQAPTAPAPAATPAPPPAPAPAPAPEPAPAAATPDATPPAEKPAPAKKKPVHHKSTAKTEGKGKLVPTKAGDAAVEDLNDASLNAAKTGKPFVAPTTPPAAKVAAHAGDKTKPAKHTMKKTKKADTTPK